MRIICSIIKQSKCGHRETGAFFSSCAGIAPVGLGRDIVSLQPARFSLPSLAVPIALWLQRMAAGLYFDFERWCNWQMKRISVLCEPRAKQEKKEKTEELHLEKRDVKKDDARAGRTAAFFASCRSPEI